MNRRHPREDRTGERRERGCDTRYIDYESSVCGRYGDPVTKQRHRFPLARPIRSSRGMRRQRSRWTMFPLSNWARVAGTEG